MSAKTRRTLFWGAGCLFLANALLWASVERDKAYIAGVASQIIPFGSRDSDVVNAVTNFIRDNIYHPTAEEVAQFPWYARWNYLYNRFRPGPQTVLRYGTHHVGPCQSNSRAFKALLDAHGIESRTIIQHDDDLIGMHSVVEVDYAGVRGICGPTYGLVYTHADGRPATLQDLRGDHDLFISNASRGFAYGWGPNAKNVKRPLPAEVYHFRQAYYFNYKWFGPFRRVVFRGLNSVLGEDGPMLVVRPAWYTYPAYTTAIVLDFTVVALLIFWGLGRGFVRWRATRVAKPNRQSASVISARAAAE